MTLSESTAQRRTWTIACRSLNLWHVAAALHAEADQFITFDTDRCNGAKTEGRASMTRHASVIGGCENTCPMRVLRNGDALQWL